MILGMATMATRIDYPQSRRKGYPRMTLQTNESQSRRRAYPYFNFGLALLWL